MKYYLLASYEQDCVNLIITQAEDRSKQDVWSMLNLVPKHLLFNRFNIYSKIRFLKRLDYHNIVIVPYEV